MNLSRLVACLCCASASLIAQVTLNVVPSKIVGQPRGNDPNAPAGRVAALSQAVNGVVGREMDGPAAVALDTTSSPPIVYVADAINNRVLAWRNPAGANNGAPADLVIGQKDGYTTGIQTLTSAPSSLFAPNGLAVDSAGNLYVADAGNNRIVRYTRPFDQPGGVVLADFVIGQPTLTSNSGFAISEKVLSITPGGGSSPSTTGLAFDATGNLWVSDSRNFRVLRFPAATLASGQPNEPSADLVLGQINFTTVVALPAASQYRNVKSLITVGVNLQAQLNVTSGLVFDSAGRLFVADGLSRVLVFTPPFNTAMPASRILGISSAATPVNATTLFGPQGLGMLNGGLLVADNTAHRILQYAPADAWPAEATAFSPPATNVIGQADFTSFNSNRGLREPTAQSLASPAGAVATATEVYIADSFNNRLLIMPIEAGTASSASKVLGQDGLEYAAPNLVEGRELWVYNGYDSNNTPLPLGSSVVDTRANPPTLFIADTYNNRILGYKDARRVKPGDRADIVIGQGDDDATGARVPDSRFYRSSANYGSATATQTNDTGLSRPSALAIDSDGNLWVADFGNSRVLRFPAPFSQPDLTIPPKANLVIGQSTFTGNKIIDASQRTLAGPHGIAFTKDGHLLVSDVLHNRILLFKKPAGADFTNGMLATSVIGQPDFVTAGPSIDNNRFFWPRGISTDTSDRLYVADSGSSRVLIFESAGNVGPDPRAAQIITNGLRRPVGIWVSPYTGEIWVADAGLNGDGSDGRAVRYPEYLTVSQNGGQINFSLASFRPIGVTSDRIDHSGNILLTEAIHRVAVYFPLVTATNAANYLTPSVRPISPGQYVSLFSPTGSNLTLTDGSLTVFSTVPMPTTLADTQVLVNDQPVPIYFVGPRQINFLAPMSLPSSGATTIQVLRVSTGDVLAVLDSAPLGVVAPGVFTLDSSGSGQAAALNEDNTINGPTNPIGRGKIIQLYATGQGFVPGAPPDGAVPGKATPAQTTLNVFFNGVAATDISYTGLAPSLIGTWQINVRIPSAVAPSNSVPVVIVANGVSSYDGSVGTPVPPRPTIAVKQ